MAEQENEEKTYEVKDKRRVNPDGTPRETGEAQPAEPQAQEEPAGGEAEPQAQEEPPAEAQAAEETAAPEEAREPDEQPAPPLLNVYDVMGLFVGTLAEHAWIRMGLRLAPGQKEPQRDLAQAKVAIDTIVFVTDKLHPHITEEERRALRGLVSDLQMNFVRQS